MVGLGATTDREKGTMPQDCHAVLPDDDHAVYEGRRKVLNRIDESAEYGCSHIVWENTDGPEYCGLPEHDPFTDRCWDHTPGNMTSLGG